MEDERYLKELKEIITSDTDTNKVPDRVCKYTTDLNGVPLPCEFVMLNEQLDFHLQKIPRHIATKNDYFAMMFGYPGSGKSHAVQRICLRLNSRFCLDDISFTPRQFESWVDNASVGSVGVLDEADVMSDHHANKMLQALIRNLKRIRTKRLIIFFVTTNMKDMKSYFASRAKMILYSFIPKNTDPGNRGWVHVWHDQDLISDLFARMKRAYSENSGVYSSSFSTLRNKYIGRDVPVDWPIDEVAYEDKKEAARKLIEEEEGLTPLAAVHKYRLGVIKRLELLSMKIESKSSYRLTQIEKAEIVDIKDRQYRALLQEVNS
jgi:hypothetical protein